MRAIVMRQFGGPDVLRLEDVPVPEPGPSEALVRVGAVTVNRSFDLKVREDGNGRDPIMPLVLGNEPAGLEAGERVLVMGAAGGLGSALVQVARHAGARVIAGAGSHERVAAAVSLGADSGVNYRQQDLALEVKKLTGGRGVDVVFENIA